MRPVVTAAPVAAWYFDGQTSRRHAVHVQLADGQLRLSGDIDHQVALASVQVSERVTHGGRKLLLPQGAYLEVLDVAAINAVLGAAGFRDSWVVRMQQSWRGALVALAVTLAAVSLVYLRGIPWIATLIADHLPAATERTLGKEALAVLDAHGFTVSTLPQAQQARILVRFSKLAEAEPACQLVFRHNAAGPNAFALPSGDIVVTDALVELLGEGDGLQGVLAHEVGHLSQRHLLRRMVQGTLVAGGGAVLFGDVSGLVAVVPTVLLDLKYSRDAEAQADDFALHWMVARGLRLDAFADALAQLDRAGAGQGSAYLSTHPAPADRIARVRQFVP